MSGLYTKKDLEWTERSEYWVAEGIEGEYHVRYNPDLKRHYWRIFNDGDAEVVFGNWLTCDSIEDGKYKAQDLHNTGLDIWLEPQPDNAGCMLCALRYGNAEFVPNENYRNLGLSGKFVETPAEVLETETPQPPDVDLQPGRTTTTGKYIRSLEETKNVDFPCSPEDGLDLGGGE